MEHAGCRATAGPESSALPWLCAAAAALPPCRPPAGSIDVRAVEDGALAGDEQCQLALAVSERASLCTCSCSLQPATPPTALHCTAGAPLVQHWCGTCSHLLLVSPLIQPALAFPPVPWQVYLRRIRKYLGAYLVHLGGRVDAVIFSAGGSCLLYAPLPVPACSLGSDAQGTGCLPAGIGENGAMLRELALAGLEWAGIAVDPAANEATIRGRAGEVQAPGSRVKVWPLLLLGAAGGCCCCRWCEASSRTAPGRCRWGLA